ncbi:MAG: 16S rRNA (guanine(966)-N(2))-methyltransferase RsmD [Acidobacteria bacterium 13_1_40CM_4_69_4]|nr:MAG: 16S rRNA (guanine(966)-N(2))-methyltransferase RsmD [Acidobacteria bacterium 13_1_40CM_4_69_4]
MRLTGGQARSRRLKTPRGLPIRPTADRVRGALFDILGSRVQGARFLDAYAGTGAVGCEALSRGAARAVLLERDRGALKLIGENLRLAPWSGSSQIIAGDVRRSLRELARRRALFDIIFLDPPYEAPGLPGALVLAARILSPAGVLVLEHRSPPEMALPDTTGLRLVRTYRYGDTSLSVCRPAGGPGRA